MSDDDGSAEEPGWGWARAFMHPEVDGVDIVDGYVRVRLRSGVELDWPMDALGLGRADGESPV